MLIVTLPVHPLTRRVLLKEYGAEPITMGDHDFLFSQLTSAKLRDRTIRSAEVLSARITLCVHDALALHLNKLSNARAAGATLFRLHKEMLVRYADAVTRTKGKGAARPAIEQWLSLYDVDEDEYSTDTAYKLWQRWNWKLKEKNPHFAGQLRGKSGVKVSGKKGVRAKKARPLEPLKMTLSEMQIEAAAARFTTLVQSCFRRPPFRIAKQARIYYYMVYGQLSCRQAAGKLGHPRTTCDDAKRSIERRAAKNPTLRRLLEEAALPEIA
jgi:hypothetical protein